MLALPPQRSSLCHTRYVQPAQTFALGCECCEDHQNDLRVSTGFGSDSARASVLSWEAGRKITIIRVADLFGD